MRQLLHVPLVQTKLVLGRVQRDAPLAPALQLLAGRRRHQDVARLAVLALRCGASLAAPLGVEKLLALLVALLLALLVLLVPLCIIQPEELRLQAVGAGASGQGWAGLGWGA